MIDVNDESVVVEILCAAQIPIDQVTDRTLVNSRGRVVTFRLNPCIGLHDLPSSVGDLSQLEELYLFWGGGEFVRLPDALGRLSKLRILQLRWCLSLQKLPPSFGQSFSNLEELTVEGCSSLDEFRCLEAAKYSWVNLKSMKIVSCARLNLSDVFRDTDKGRPEEEVKQFFPSLSRLTLRRNGMNGNDLANIWSFLERCPSLSYVDLSDNEIETFHDLATRRKTSITGHGMLRHLNLAGNPVLHSVVSEQVEASSDENTIPQVSQTHNSSEHDFLLEVLTVYPQLESIGACRSINLSYNEPNSSSPTSANECLSTSHLYSPKLQHALDLNMTRKGKNHMLLDETLFPLSMWPLLLGRVTSSAQFCPSNSKKCQLCHQCGALERSLFSEREASVLFSLLKGPALASR